jgi:hypothetical protein
MGDGEVAVGGGDLLLAEAVAVGGGKLLLAEAVAVGGGSCCWRRQLLFQENKSFGASTICIHPLMNTKKPCREQYV